MKNCAAAANVISRIGRVRRAARLVTDFDRSMTNLFQQNRPLVRAAWFIGAYNLLFVSFLYARPGTHIQFQTVDDLLQSGGGLLSALFCYAGIKPKRLAMFRLRDVPKHEWMALLCCLGMASYASGQICWAYAELVKHNTTQFPAIDDVFYLISILSSYWASWRRHRVRCRSLRGRESCWTA